MLQGSSVYAQEIKDNVNELKKNIDDAGLQEIITLILEILDFIIENSVQLEEQMAQTLKSGIEYCASPNESIDAGHINVWNNLLCLDLTQDDIHSKNLYAFKINKNIISFSFEYYGSSNTKMSTIPALYLMNFELA